MRLVSVVSFFRSKDRPLNNITELVKFLRGTCGIIQLCWYPAEGSHMQQNYISTLVNIGLLSYYKFMSRSFQNIKVMGA